MGGHIGIMENQMENAIIGCARVGPLLGQMHQRWTW